MEYGSGYQGIERIYVGQGQLLAKLTLPAPIAATSGQYVLHPVILAAALQAVIGFNPDVSKANQPLLPVALQELAIYGRCTGSRWALLQYGIDNRVKDQPRKLDIDICDEEGHVCLRLKGLEYEPSSRSDVSDRLAASFTGKIMLTPLWEVISIAPAPLFPALTDRVIIGGDLTENTSAIRQYYPNATQVKLQPGDTGATIAKKLTAHGNIDHLLWLAPPQALTALTDEALIEGQHEGVLQVFRLIKALLELGYGNRSLGFTVITVATQSIRKSEAVNPIHASLHGLVGSMAKEYPNWKLRLIDLESSKDWPITDIFTIPPDLNGNSLAYRGGKWYQQQLVPVQYAAPQPTLYKAGGVYVVIGGAGGIGEAWSEYVIRTYQAHCDMDRPPGKGCSHSSKN